MIVLVIVGCFLIFVPPFFSNTQESATWAEILESIGVSFLSSSLVSFSVDYVNFKNKKEVYKKEISQIKRIFISYYSFFMMDLNEFLINMDINNCYLFPKNIDEINALQNKLMKIDLHSISVDNMKVLMKIRHSDELLRYTCTVLQEYSQHKNGNKEMNDDADYDTIIATTRKLLRFLDSFSADNGNVTKRISDMFRFIYEVEIMILRVLLVLDGFEEEVNKENKELKTFCEFVYEKTERYQKAQEEFWVEENIEKANDPYYPQSLGNEYVDEEFSDDNDKSNDFTVFFKAVKTFDSNLAYEELLKMPEELLSSAKKVLDRSEFLMIRSSKLRKLYKEKFNVRYPYFTLLIQGKKRDLIDKMDDLIRRIRYKN